MSGKYREIIIILAFVASLSCNKKNPVVSEGTPQPDYYPISSGSWWQYSSHTDSIGECDTLIDGSSVQALYTFISSTSYKTYLRNINNDIRKYLFLNDTGSYYVIFKSPLSVGMKWQVFDYNDTVDATYDSMYVISTGTITVPAGTFANCFQILRKRDNQREDPDSSKKWYAPYVGFVFNPGDSTKLISYSIK